MPRYRITIFGQGRKASADLVRNPKLAEQLHGARVVDVALGVPAGLGLCVEDCRLYAVHIQMQGEREANRSAAYNGDVR